MDMWEIYRKNLRFVRKHFKITQNNISAATGINRSAYHYFETKGFGGPSFPLITNFWLSNFGITPNDLLLRELTAEDMKKFRRIVKIKVKAKKKD